MVWYQMDKICSICVEYGDERPAYAKGLCSSHYGRLRRGNFLDSPIGGPGQKHSEFESDLDRFWSKVDKSGECWEWMGSKPPSKNGYGTFSVSNPRRTIKACVWIWEQSIGQPMGCIVPICGNNGCVRLDHLNDLTHAQKDRRRTDKITHCPSGHEYNQANTYVDLNNHRQCRACLSVRTHVRRSMVEAGDPTISIDWLAERDEWICQLCDDMVDPTIIWPALGARTIDHILPVSLGGSHEKHNVQLAHWGCNMDKGNRVEELANVNQR